MCITKRTSFLFWYYHGYFNYTSCGLLPPPLLQIIVRIYIFAVSNESHSKTTNTVLVFCMKKIMMMFRAFKE